MTIEDPFKDSEEERDRITEEQKAQIRSLYREALRELKKSFKYYANSDSISAPLKMVYIKQIKKEIDESMSYIDRSTEKIITQNTDKMVNYVLENNQKYLTGLGYNSYINNPEIKVDVVNRIISGDLYKGKWNLSSAIWGDNQAKLNEINRIIAKGLIKNKSLYEISKSLERYVSPRAYKTYEWSKMFPGSRKKVDYNAQRLARTMIQHAYQQSLVEATRMNPFVVGYKWVTSGAHNVCQLCIERENQDDYGLGEGVYPKDELPLDHPNGNCTFEIVTEYTDDEMASIIKQWQDGTLDDEMANDLDDFENFLENY